MDNKSNGTTQDLLTFDLDSVVSTGMTKNKQRFKILALIVGIISICVIAVFIFLFAILPMEQYDRACRLLEQEKYNEACTSFESLGDYKDSKEKAAEAAQYASFQRAYNYAIFLWERGNLEDAIYRFTQVIDFKDSADCIAQIKYDSAKDIWKSGDLLGALEQFEAIESFRDTPNCILQIKDQLYNNALKLLESDQFQEANAIFSILGDYPHISEKVELVTQGETYQAALAAESVSIADALKLYQQLPIDYKDVSARISKINLYIDYAGTYCGSWSTTDYYTKPHEHSAWCEFEVVICFSGNNVCLEDGVTHIFDNNVATGIQYNQRTGRWREKRSFTFENGYFTFENIINPAEDLSSPHVGRFKKIK